MGMVSTVLAVVTLAILLVLSFVVARVIRSGAGLEKALRAPETSVENGERPVELAEPYELIQSRHGPMLVNPNDFYLGKAIIWYGECCELELAILLQLMSFRPGIVVEVGANIGTHTVPMARTLATQGRRLVTFEPQPFIFQNMCTNLALNGLANVVAWPFACSDREATVHFSPPNYAADGNFGGVSMSFDATENNVAVPCHPLDAIVGAEQVSMIKIDVEGFELLVLQGAVNILAKSRPVLYVENDRVEQSAELIDWLSAKNYQLWWHIPRLFNPDNFFKNDDNHYQNVDSFNMVCLPHEMNFRVTGLDEVLLNAHPLAR